MMNAEVYLMRAQTVRRAICPIDNELHFVLAVIVFNVPRFDAEIEIGGHLRLESAIVIIAIIRLFNGIEFIALKIGRSIHLSRFFLGEYDK